MLELQHPASWPSGKELFYHLDYVPFIRLRVPFDYSACFLEAKALLPRFVAHRSYDQTSEDGGSGAWKSLAIQAVGGDSTKTLHHSEYGLADPKYSLTEIAELCPKTMGFLRQVTDLEKCERVRFMLLEPGARIHVHTDAGDRDVCPAVNIALNMPEGCEFFIDTDKSGKHTEFTKKIPFSAGDTMLINIAKHHYVVNNSNEDRIHIIISGPIRIPSTSLLESAKKQNQISEERLLVQKLVQKKLLQGEALDRTPTLIGDWKLAGLLAEGILPQAEILVMDDPDLAEPVRKTCLELITFASLFPAKLSVIKQNELDSHLRTIDLTKTKFAVVCNLGTWVHNLQDFLLEATKCFCRLQELDTPVMGHLMDWKDGRPKLPYLHEQFAIVNLKKWHELGCPAFDRPYHGKKTTFPPYLAAHENIHDDYTPIWLRPCVDRGEPKSGKAGWGTEILAASIQAGLEVPNLPIPLRELKRFAYPLDTTWCHLDELKAEIDRYISRLREHVFLFNNEPLKGMKFPEFSPEHLLTVSAGLKPFALLDQYFSRVQQITIFDHNPKSIQYLQGMLNVRSVRDLRDWIWEFGSKHCPGQLTSIEVVETKLKREINLYFDDSNAKLLDAIRKFGDSKMEWLCGDFISEPSLVTSRLDRSRDFLFWHSNSWVSNISLYRRSLSELHRNYNQLISSAADKHGFRVAREGERFESVFTDASGKVRGYFSDNSSPRATYRPDLFSQPAMPQ